ncbi:MAG TPA: cupin domain-containing protein [Gemmatimonadaceae bacterium]
MRGFIDNIQTLTGQNRDFRRVVYTARHIQLVLMTLEPGAEIGEEVHPDTDQFFRVEEGRGEVMIEGAMTRVERDMVIIVPAGARHNIRNTGKLPLKVYTLYAPPHHADGTVHHTKVEADKSTEHFAGITTE